MNATTGTLPQPPALDALAFDWRATGSTASQMMVSSILVTGHQTLLLSTPPVLGAKLSDSSLALSWPNNPGWLLQSNAAGLGTTNWSTVPNSGSATNFVVTVNPAMGNVFYRLLSP